jgi:hypothetical protein
MPTFPFLVHRPHRATPYINSYFLSTISPSKESWNYLTTTIHYTHMATTIQQCLTKGHFGLLLYVSSWLLVTHIVICCYQPFALHLRDWWQAPMLLCYCCSLQMWFIICSCHEGLPPADMWSSLLWQMTTELCHLNLYSANARRRCLDSHLIGTVLLESVDVTHCGDWHISS